MRIATGIEGDQTRPRRSKTSRLPSHRGLLQQKEDSRFLRPIAQETPALNGVVTEFEKLHLLERSRNSAWERIESFQSSGTGPEL
jgi:hypothetical protein